MNSCHNAKLMFIAITACLVLSGCASKARIPFSAEACMGANYEQVLEELRDQGFSNIITTEIDDLITPVSEGAISAISINGDMAFAAEAKYPKEAEIHITYHTIKKIFPPMSSKDISQYDIASAKEAFETAGFTNVKAVGVEDLTSETRDQEGDLSSIVIGDVGGFNNDMRFPCNSEVTISFHTLKMVSLPVSSEEIGSAVFSDVQEKFKAAGFTNIDVTAIDDLTSKSPMKDGTVTKVLVLGESSFEKNTILPHDAKVEITYHLIKKVKAPLASGEARNLPCAEVTETFKMAGFSHVKTTEIFDLDPDETRDEYINEVTINNDSSYSKTKEYPFDAPISITSHRPFEKYTITAHITCEENWIFNKYDIDILFDEHKEKTLPHGGSSDYTFRAASGVHTLTFTSKDDPSIKGTATINVSVDTELAYKICCYGSSVEVKTLWEDKKISLAADELKIQAAASAYQTKTYNEVVKELKSAGFTNIKTKAIYDLRGSWLEVDGEIESISIGGRTNFVPNDVFKKNAPVIITYHTLKLPTDKIQEKITNNIGKPASVTIASFEETTYKVICIVAGEERAEFDPKGYILESGYLDIEKEIAYLSFITRAQSKLNAQLEQSFPQETAKRAAVVALTNSQATDVFKADRNSYDKSKFHSYSDISGFFLTFVDEGTWSAKDEYTWHVHEIRLEIFGYGTQIKATLDVKKDGETYIVFNADKVVGAKDKIDDGKTYSTEHMDPSDSNPYLTVSAALVEEDRDNAAVQAKIDAKKAHDKWADSHQIDRTFDSLIKDNLNDEDSYERKSTEHTVIYEDFQKTEINNLLKKSGYSARVEIGDIFIRTNFSAKNAFNATIKSTAIGIAKYSTNEIILVDIL